MDDGKPDTTSVLAAAAVTLMPAWLPVIVAVVLSVAVSDWVPAVFKVMLKECAPLSALTKL